MQQIIYLSNEAKDYVFNKTKKGILLFMYHCLSDMVEELNQQLKLEGLYNKVNCLENIIGATEDYNGDGWGQFVYSEEDRIKAKQDLEKVFKSGY